MIFRDEHVVNMMKELAPQAEIHLLRSYKGKKLDWENYATYLINGRFGWCKLSSLEEDREHAGPGAVWDRLAKLLERSLGSKVNTGTHTKHELSERLKRYTGARAETLEWAMKSAGSTSKEIYDDLKYA